MHYHFIHLDSSSKVNLNEMVIKPKTIKDIQANTRVLNALNKNHKDDMFSVHGKKTNEAQKVRYYVYSICIVSHTPNSKS